MPIQIIPARRTFGAEFGRALGGGVGKGFSEGVSKEFERQKEQEKLSKQDQAASNYYEQITGQKLPSNLSPEIKKSIFTEMLKSQGKQQLQDRELAAIEELFGGGQKKKGAQLAAMGQETQEMGQGQNVPVEGHDGINPLEITPEQILKATAIKPNLGKAVQGLSDTAQRKKEYQEGLTVRQKELFHKESQKYDQTLTDQSVAAEKKNRALERQLKNVDKIDWWDRAVSSVFGTSKFGDLLRSSTAQEFDANMLPQLEGQRQILGGVLSDSDIRILMQKIVTASKNPEANKAIAKNMMFENNLLKEKRKIGDQIRKENGGYRPANYESEIERVYNEKLGPKIEEHFNEIMALPDDPEKLKNITGRVKVPNGTTMPVAKAREYLEKAGGDRKLAEQWGREDGYKF